MIQTQENEKTTIKIGDFIKIEVKNVEVSRYHLENAILPAFVQFQVFDFKVRVHRASNGMRFDRFIRKFMRFGPKGPDKRQKRKLRRLAKWQKDRNW